jgi:hypothetical protein
VFSYTTIVYLIEVRKVLKRLKNDDTLTKLGDIYHYLLVLKHCCELKEGETIFVEQFGDITKISPDDSYQMEVKHHVEENKIRDRDSEFWNTLKNWLENELTVRQFKYLILLTTSYIDSSSIFSDWNLSNGDERLKRIKDMGQERKKKEATFRGLYNRIFDNFSDDVIKSILEKVVLRSSENNVTLIKEEIKKHPHFQNVSSASFEPYINDLLGFIVNKPIHPPFRWEIKYIDFKNYSTELRDRYSLKGRVIPPKYDGKIIDNYDSYSDRKFVHEIRKINYETEVEEAINNVWRKNNTVIEYFEDNYVFFEDLETYKNGLREKMNYKKKNLDLDFSDQDKKKRIKESKKFFNGAMSMELERFGMINSNVRFFQNGVIHEIVDDEDLYWYIESDEE